VLTKILNKRLTDRVGKRRRKSKRAKANRRRALQRPSITIHEVHIHHSPPVQRKGWRPSVAQFSLAASLFVLLFGNNVIFRLTSSPVPLSALVSFFRTDTTTKNDQPGRYGSEGYANEARMSKDPKVKILSPANGSTFRVGETVPIVALAIGSKGTKATKIRFHVLA